MKTEVIAINNYQELLEAQNKYDICGKAMLTALVMLNSGAPVELHVPKATERPTKKVYELLGKNPEFTQEVIEFLQDKINKRNKEYKQEQLKQAIASKEEALQYLQTEITNLKAELNGDTDEEKA